MSARQFRKIIIKICNFTQLLVNLVLSICFTSYMIIYHRLLDQKATGEQVRNMQTSGDWFLK